MGGCLGVADGPGGFGCGSRHDTAAHGVLGPAPLPCGVVLYGVTLLVPQLLGRAACLLCRVLRGALLFRLGLGLWLGLWLGLVFLLGLVF